MRGSPPNPHLKKRKNNVYDMVLRTTATVLDVCCQLHFLFRNSLRRPKDVKDTKRDGLPNPLGAVVIYSMFATCSSSITSDRYEVLANMSFVVIIYEWS